MILLSKSKDEGSSPSSPANNMNFKKSVYKAINGGNKDCIEELKKFFKDGYRVVQIGGVGKETILYLKKKRSKESVPFSLQDIKFNKNQTKKYLI